MQQDAGLRQVRDDHIGQAAQLPHAFCHGLGIGGVQLPVIRHDGIHKGQGILLVILLQHIAHQLNLLKGAKKAGIQPVKAKGQGGKVGGNLLHFLGQIQAGVAREFSRMGGKQGSRQGGGVQSAGGKHRQCHRQGAASHAAKIMNGQYLLLHGYRLLVFRLVFCFLIIRHEEGICKHHGENMQSTSMIFPFP